MQPKFPTKRIPRPRIGAWENKADWVEDIRVHPYSGVLEFVSENGMKTSAPERSRVGELDDICETVIDYPGLQGLAPDDEVLRHYIAMLTEIKAVESEMTMPPEKAPPGIRRGISHHMLSHKEKLLRRGVIREATRVRAITSFFTVAKKSGRLRLVVDGRRVNALMKRIPPMELPAIQEVLLYLMSNKFFCTVDGVSYFYQFGISVEVGELFCANLAGTKGEFVPVALTRMPMGWSWAPAIAQKASNVLLQGKDGPLGICWVDNFVFAGRTRHEVLENFRQFLVRADAANVKLDSREPEVMEVGEILGMLVDLPNGRLRMSDKWAVKVSALAPAKWMTPRQIYTLSGNGIWQSTVGRTPLCRWSTCVDLVRRMATGIHAGLDWDTPVRLTPEEVRELQRWHTVMKENEWVTYSPESAPTKHVWSDASDREWAWVVTGLEDEHEESARQGVFTHPEWHIFVKEAYAANCGVQATRGTPRLLLIDNQPLVFAIMRRLSSNKMVNEWMSTWDWENISVRWVPTTEQKADKYTRGICIQQTASTIGYGKA